ncbi:unnamed protein product [Clonostachys chloroleuca]|uniref:Uncharacterized protein n=1 Tax=Clonostachys chloroleuca TaxID=1926264 RepID=A0AA35QBS2_9HYPO|nr:unnamed protein product [Clonostachys chloroleuca]
MTSLQDPSMAGSAVLAPHQFSYMKLQCTAGFVLTGLLGAAALALAFVSLFSGKKQPEEIAQVAAQGVLVPLLFVMAVLMQTIQHDAPQPRRSESFLLGSYGVFGVVNGVMTTYGDSEKKSASVKLGKIALLVLGVLSGVVLHYGIRELTQALSSKLEDPTIERATLSEAQDKSPVGPN